MSAHLRGYKKIEIEIKCEKRDTIQTIGSEVSDLNFAFRFGDRQVAVRCRDHLRFLQVRMIDE
jgi:hypothetical protein